MKNCCRWNSNSSHSSPSSWQSWRGRDRPAGGGMGAYICPSEPYRSHCPITGGGAFYIQPPAPPAPWWQPPCGRHPLEHRPGSQPASQTIGLVSIVQADFFCRKSKTAYMPTRFLCIVMVIRKIWKIEPTQSLHKAYTIPTRFWGKTAIFTQIHRHRIYKKCRWITRFFVPASHSVTWKSNYCLSKTRNVLRANLESLTCNFHVVLCVIALAVTIGTLSVPNGFPMFQNLQRLPVLKFSREFFVGRASG